MLMIRVALPQHCRLQLALFHGYMMHIYLIYNAYICVYHLQFKLVEFGDPVMWSSVTCHDRQLHAYLVSRASIPREWTMKTPMTPVADSAHSGHKKIAMYNWGYVWSRSAQDACLCSHVRRRPMKKHHGRRIYKYNRNV